MSRVAALRQSWHDGLRSLGLGGVGSQEGQIAAAQECLPEEWRWQRCRRGVLELTSQAWCVGPAGWVRHTEISSEDGTWIVNLGAFSLSAPWAVAQLEIVVIKGRLAVLIADVCDERGAYQGPGLQRPRSDLPQAMDRPLWCDGLISQEALWSKPMTETALDSAGLVVSEWLQWLAGELFREMGRGPQPGAARPGSGSARADYLGSLCLRFREHEPSRPFFHGLFGEAWAERYIAEFLFPGFIGEARLEAFSLGGASNRATSDRATSELPSRRLRRLTGEAHAQTESTELARRMAGGHLDGLAHGAALLAHEMLLARLVSVAREHGFSDGELSGLQRQLGWAQDDLVQWKGWTRGGKVLGGGADLWLDERRATIAAATAEVMASDAVASDAVASDAVALAPVRARLLGWLYVFSGAAMGARTLFPLLRDSLGPGAPLAFYEEQVRSGGMAFQAVRRLLDEQLADAASFEQALQGALAAFAAVRSAFDAALAGWAGERELAGGVRDASSPALRENARQSWLGGAHGQ